LHQSWPRGGEVDLIEQKGKQQTYDVAVICGEDRPSVRWDLQSVYAANKPPLNKTVDGAFHVYSMHWTDSFIKIYLDGNLVGWSDTKCANKVSSFDPHYILLTMLMGTSGAGYPDTSKGSVFGVMDVDYVRVWQ
jgi:beta-glucanase (GH16 family)